MADWRTIMGVDEWAPPKRRAWRGPRVLRDNRGARVMLFSVHHSWSITWRRFLEIEPQRYRYFRRFWLKFNVSKYNSGAGQAQLAFLRLWVFSYHWQPNMRKQPAPRCKVCGDRIDADSTVGCGMARPDCPMPEAADKRAVYAKWASERGAS